MGEFTVQPIARPGEFSSLGIQLLVKRSMDLVVGFAAVVILWPVFLWAAVAIRVTSSGPVIFRQTRLGLGGIPFTCYKFRTMYVDAPDMRNPDGSTFNADDDPRVTAVGKFLRKISLDELPQIFNVLKGDMSLVGPRPDIVEFLPFYRPGDERRLAVKPGMTGWAAIHGRNRVPLPERRALDIDYVDSFSLWLDIKILLATVPLVLLSKGIYTSAPQGESDSEHM